MKLNTIECYKDSIKNIFFAISTHQYNLLLCFIKVGLSIDNDVQFDRGRGIYKIKMLIIYRFRFFFTEAKIVFHKIVLCLSWEINVHQFVLYLYIIFFFKIKMKIRVLCFTTFWNLHKNTWWTSCNQFQHFKCHTEFENPSNRRYSAWLLFSISTIFLTKGIYKV